MTPDRTGQRIDNYHLAQKLGGGSFGQVYLAEDLRRKTKVAIKVLDPFITPKERDQFFDEVRSLVRLRHPYIVSVIDFGIDKTTNLPFIVMEYAPNGSLREKHHGQQLPLATVVQYIKQIASALQYAHDDQLIHRDVKPHNVFIGTNGELLLGDFGIAILSSTGLISLQQPQGSGGTPVYMAPEQIKGMPSRSSDQYALAIITYEWLCGKPPFTGSMMEIIGQHLNAAPQPIREFVPPIPPQVEQVILRALSKEVKDRFPTIQEFADALEAASKTVPIGTRLLTYIGHSFGVDTVAWSPDGSRIASAAGLILNKDNTVQVWSAVSGQRLLTYTEHADIVHAVVWSPDGSLIASGSRDNTVQVWKASSGQLLHTYNGNDSIVNDVAWSPDG